MVNVLCVRPLAFFLFLFLVLISCSKKDNTNLINELIGAAAELAEAHDTKALIQLTSEDFYAQPGPHDRQETRKILWWAFRKYGEFKIIYPEPSIDLVETTHTATARIYFMIVRKEQSFPDLKDLYHDPEAWLEEVGMNADLYRLGLDLVKKNGDWIVKKALLEPFKGIGFGPWSQVFLKAPSTDTERHLRSKSFIPKS